MRHTLVLRMIVLVLLLPCSGITSAETERQKEETDMQPEEIPETQLGADGGLFGMRVESVEKSTGGISIVTTGAAFLFNTGDGAIECSQRIPAERKVATISAPLAGMKVVRKHDGAVWLSNKDLGLRINCDSVLFITPKRNVKVAIRSAFKPAWQAGPKRGNIMVADGSGGFLVFPLWDKPEPSVKCGDLRAKNPEVNCSVPARKKLLISVYPPRPFDWDEYYNGARGEVYVQHYGSIAHCVSLDLKNKPVVKKALANGYRPLGGRSIYYHKKSTPHEWVLSALTHIRKGARCIYSDGLAMKGPEDTLYSYETLRRFRAYPETRDCIFIAHSSWGPPIGDTIINSPFIHCYADYLLRGEHSPPGQLDARYYFAGHGISNAIGCWCWWSRGGPKISRKHLKMMLDNHMIWWNSGKYAGIWDTVDYAALTDYYIPEYSRRYFKRLGYNYLKPASYAQSSWRGSNYRSTTYDPKLTGDGKVLTGCWKAGRSRGRYGYFPGQKEYLAQDLGGSALIGGIGYDSRYPTFTPDVPHAVRQEAFRICVSDNPNPDFDAEPGESEDGGWVTVAEKKHLDVACRFNFAIDPPVRGRWVRVDNIKAIYPPLPRGVLMRYETIYGKESLPPPYVTELTAFGKRVTKVSAADESDRVRIHAAFSEPVIDGKLIDVAWKVTPPIYRWYSVADPAAPQHQTTAFLTYTPTDVFVAFECTGKVRKGKDSVVFLFSPDRKTVSCYEITCKGKVSGPGTPECVVQAGDDRWTAEMRIPASDIAFEPKNGKTVWINFARYRGGRVTSYARYRANGIDEKILCPLKIDDPNTYLERANG